MVVATTVTTTVTAVVTTLVPVTTLVLAQPTQLQVGQQQGAQGIPPPLPRTMVLALLYQVLARALPAATTLLTLAHTHTVALVWRTSTVGPLRLVTLTLALALALVLVSPSVPVLIQTLYCCSCRAKQQAFA